MADLKSLWDFGKKFKEWCEGMAAKRGMPWVFSHAIVPVMVGCWVAPSLVGLRPFLGPREHIGVVPMYSRLTPEGTTENVEAVAIVLESASYDFAMAWKRDAEVEVLTSLAGGVIGVNERKLGRSADGLWVHMPPTGHAGLVTIVAKGILPEEVYLDKRKISLGELKIVSRQSAAVAMTTFGAALFGFGLVLNSMHSDKYQEHRAGRLSGEARASGRTSRRRKRK